MKSEKYFDDVVVQLTRILDTKYKRRESALPHTGHRIRSGHVERSEHWNLYGKVVFNNNILIFYEGFQK